MGPGEYLITYLINELVGKWKISNESGGSPSKKLAISTSGRLNDGKRTTNMKLSNNETFPFNHGWLMAANDNKGVMSQDYFRYDDDTEIMEIQRFSTDHECRGIFHQQNSPVTLKNYCGADEGRRGKLRKSSKNKKKDKRKKKNRKSRKPTTTPTPKTTTTTTTKKQDKTMNKFSPFEPTSSM